MSRLTPAQLRELREIASRDYGSHYADEYKPVQRLLALGYVERKDSKWGSSTYTATDLGRFVTAVERIADAMEARHDLP